MRIAVITSWPTEVSKGSGTAVFFNAFISALQSKGFTLDIIAPSFDISDYVEVTLKRFLFNTELRTDPRLLSADVIIGFDYDGYGIDTLNSPPLISSAHAVFGDVIQWETDPIRTMVHAQAFFDAVAMNKAKRVTIGSQYAKDRIVELYHVPAEQIVVIPHGMLTPSWMQYLNAEPRVENDHPVILSVGKMYPRKRTNILLKAISLLREKHPTVELRIVGDGLEWNRLHQLADSLQLGSNLTWLDHIYDDQAMAREWRQADIFAHPSNQETFGYVYLEAMSVGVPIVAARAGAAPEVLQDAALLVEPENPTALAFALDQLLMDAELRKTIVSRGKARSQLYTMERMADAYAKTIEEVVSETGVSQPVHLHTN